jgi:hypothetical protein
MWNDLNARADAEPETDADEEGSAGCGQAYEADRDRIQGNPDRASNSVYPAAGRMGPRMNRASECLSQFAELVVRTAGLEPATSCSGGKRSIQLSYARVKRIRLYRSGRR